MRAARGRRKLRTVNGTATVTITGADDRALLDYDGTTGAVLRWYAHGPGPNAVLNQMNVPAATRDTLLPDTLGSVIASVDASGAITKFGYQPFGLTPTPPPQFGFTGQRPDQETGLYYYRARQYSPEWGRFTQPDPIGYGGGANLYAYVYNDPLNLLDPEGLAALNAIQAGLTVASFCPSVCGSIFSLLDAGVSAGRGDYVGAGISVTAAGLGAFSDAGAWKLAGMGAIGAADALKASRSSTLNPAFQQGFSSHSDLVRYLGPAGEGRAWHHVVEQTPANITKFGAERVHNINNVVNLPHGSGQLHNQISGFYSSLAPGGGTIRSSLANKSFQEQYDFGVRTMQKYFDR